MTLLPSYAVDEAEFCAVLCAACRTHVQRHLRKQATAEDLGFRFCEPCEKALVSFISDLVS